MFSMFQVALVSMFHVFNVEDVPMFFEMVGHSKISSRVPRICVKKRIDQMSFYFPLDDIGILE